MGLFYQSAGLAHLVGSDWRSGGSLAGLKALFWEPGRAQVAAAAEQAADGDFRGAAASTVKAVSVGVATGVALGKLRAAVVDAAVAASSTGSGASGAAGGPRAGKPFTRSGKRNLLEALTASDRARAAMGPPP
jgi:hypothetical protein